MPFHRQFITSVTAIYGPALWRPEGGVEPIKTVREIFLICHLFCQLEVIHYHGSIHKIYNDFIKGDDLVELNFKWFSYHQMFYYSILGITL